MRDQPAAVRLFAALFGVGVALSILLAGVTARQTGFGFAIPPAAAATLAARILAIRLLGCLFAVVLMLLVVAGRSRAARGALSLRWLLGLVTSVAFLRGIGLVPAESAGAGWVALSVVQLGIEGLAIVMLYGEDAAPWFARAPRAVSPNE